jgi:hypothetical protein
MGRTAHLGPKWPFSPMDAGIVGWEPWGMETVTDSAPTEAHGAHQEPMLKLAIRCHPGVPVESDELERWLTAQVTELRTGAPRAIIRLSRLTQHFPSSDAAIGWLLELEMPEESPLLSKGRLTNTLADMRMLGIEPTPLTPLESPNPLGLSTAEA